MYLSLTHHRRHPTESQQSAVLLLYVHLILSIPGTAVAARWEDLHLQSCKLFTILELDEC